MVRVHDGVDGVTQYQYGKVGNTTTITSKEQQRMANGAREEQLQANAVNLENFRAKIAQGLKQATFASVSSPATAT